MIHTDRSIYPLSEISSLLTGQGVVIDLGTGDGTFVYHAARQNPQKFYIGIDANPQPLAKISEKIHRKPTKGGLPNVMFVQASMESLPLELECVADEIHIHFPWGSLLRAVATADELMVQGLRHLCAPGAMVEIVMSLDPVRDQTEIAALGLSPITNEFMERHLIPRYEAVGFEVIEYGILALSEWPHLNTTWAKRLHTSGERALTYLILRTIDDLV